MGWIKQPVFFILSWGFITGLGIFIGYASHTRLRRYVFAVVGVFFATVAFLLGQDLFSSLADEPRLDKGLVLLAFSIIGSTCLVISAFPSKK